MYFALDFVWDCRLWWNTSLQLWSTCQRIQRPWLRLLLMILLKSCLRICWYAGLVEEWICEFVGEGLSPCRFDLDAHCQLIKSIPYRCDIHDFWVEWSWCWCRSGSPQIWWPSEGISWDISMNSLGITCVSFIEHVFEEQSGRQGEELLFEALHGGREGWSLSLYYVNLTECLCCICVLLTANWLASWKKVVRWFAILIVIFWRICCAICILPATLVVMVSSACSRTLPRMRIIATFSWTKNILRNTISSINYSMFLLVTFLLKETYVLRAADHM